MNHPDPVTRLNEALEGRYRIERQLGEGGMATVYLADDLKHERKVALKVLKPELAAVVGAERFLAEIKTTANLQHPHILPLHDSGEADSFLFYVMPYVEGESLRDRLDREHQLPVDEAVQIAKDVGEALAYAHSHCVIHRDIKPGNILIHSGRPVISDFGIALAVGAAGGGRLTETGLSLGTPHYMSPEQATGDAHVGPATDIYALGCVLYEMLAGEPPYTGTSAQAVLGKIIAGAPVSATGIRKSVLPNVDAAIRKALEKLPADRFGGAQEFARALGDPSFRHGAEAVAGVAGGVGPWKRVSALGWSVAALLALTLGLLLLRPTPRPVARFEVTLAEDRSLAPGVIGVEFTLSPDGSRIVYVGLNPEGGTHLWQRALNALEPDPIPGTEGAISPVLSPDGLSVVFHVSGTGGSKKTILLGGGPPFTVLPSGRSNAVTTAWGPDGMIYFGGQNIIHRVPATGGEPEAVTSPTTGQHVFPDVLPDGRGLLLTVRGNTLDQDRIAVLGPEGGEVREILTGTMARYAASGHVVYATVDGTLWAAAFDLKRLDVTGPAVALLDGVQVKAAGQSQFALSAAGMLLYKTSSALSGMHQLLVVDLEGNEEPLVLAPRNIGLVAWSPDGQSVVYDSEGQIYTYNVVLGTTPRQLTFEGTNVRPVYSPDGSRVAFRSTREGTDGQDLFVKDLNDDSPPRSIIALPANQWPTQWPSDTLIVFERGEGGVRDIWTVDLSDPDNPRAEAYLSSAADLRRMVVSPDGTLAAYTSNESGEYEIYVRSFPDPGGLTKVSENGGDDPFWSPDGNTLYYSLGDGVGGRFKAARIQRNPVPVVLSTDSLFWALVGEPTPGSGLHPDGDRFILAQDASNVGASVPDRLILVQNFFEELKARVPN